MDTNKQISVGSNNSLGNVIEEKIDIVNRGGGGVLTFRPKMVKVGGRTFQLDAMQMIRMIRRITQQIGEYKGMDNCYSEYIIPSLRKCRGDLISDLEEHFRIHCEISTSGKTVFYV